MAQRRQYRNPPIEEALCEFRFEPGQEWDLTIPGRLHVQLSKDYSGKPQQQKFVDVSLDAQKGKPPKLSYGEGLAKVQLFTEDGKRIVAVGQDVLSIHMLRPYQDPHRTDSGWDEFQQRIEQALDVYWDEVQPKGVLWVSIRYINKIVIPKEAVEVESYLKCALPDVKGLPDHQNSFLSRAGYVYDDGVHLVLAQRSIDAPPPNQVEFLLDIDVIWANTEPVGKDEALAKAVDLRDRERVAFEAVITDKARELFDVDGN